MVSEADYADLRAELERTRIHLGDVKAVRSRLRTALVKAIELLDADHFDRREIDPLRATALGTDEKLNDGEPHA